MVELKKRIISDYKYFIRDVFWKEMTMFGDLTFFILVILAFFFMGFQILAQKLLLSVVLAFAIVIFIRSVYFKERPKKQKYETYLQKIESSSFPSMHAIRITILGCFFISTFAIFNIRLQLFFMLIMLLTILSRYFMKKHFIVDLVIGFLIGLAIHYLVENILF